MGVGTMKTAIKTKQTLVDKITNKVTGSNISTTKTKITNADGSKVTSKVKVDANTGNIVKSSGTNTKYQTPVISNSAKTSKSTGTKSTSKSSVTAKSTLGNGASKLGTTALITAGVVGGSYLLKDTSLFNWGSDAETLTPDEQANIIKETTEKTVVDYMNGVTGGMGDGGTAYIGGEGVYPEEYADESSGVFGEVAETVTSYAPIILCVVIIIILIVMAKNGKSSKKGKTAKKSYRKPTTYRRYGRRA